MRSTLLLVLLTVAFGAALRSAVDDHWIVVFHQNSTSVDRARHFARFQPAVENVYDIGRFQAYSARMNASMIKDVAYAAEVSYVEADQIMSVSACTTQSGATWGLNRIDQRALPLDGRYTYTQNGEGVLSYIVDTGIYIGNLDFGGRAIFGGNFADKDNRDCNGHGTHVAGTVGSTTWGVAKKTTLIAVKVLACDGTGTNTGVIAGINFVAKDAKARGKPAVANMSLGGGKSTALNDAVANAVISGVTFVVAAGNDNADACLYSPASEPLAVTVGATDKLDSRSTFSNFGSCTDIFAPGTDITSTWIGSPTATRTISGTSMASPHVAGVAALYVSSNPQATPTAVRNHLVSVSTNGVLNLNCKTSSCSASPNKLLYTAGC